MRLDADAAARGDRPTSRARSGAIPRTPPSRSSRIANELMIEAIGEITVNEGVDPRESVDRRRRRRGRPQHHADRPRARLPRGCCCRAAPAALAPAACSYSDIVAEASRSLRHRLSDSFDAAGVNRALDEVDAAAEASRAGLAERGAPRSGSSTSSRRATAPRCGSSRSRCRVDRFTAPSDVAALVEALPPASTSASTPCATRASAVEMRHWKVRAGRPRRERRRCRACAGGRIGAGHGRASARRYFGPAAAARRRRSTAATTLRARRRARRARRSSRSRPPRSSSTRVCAPR